jgi:hypothetical protein
MMKKTSVTFFILLFVFTMNISSQDKDIKLSLADKKNDKPVLTTDKVSVKYTPVLMSDLRSRMLESESFENKLDINRINKTLLPESPKKKSVLLGIGLSALVPGLGEFYAKSYLKAGIFFAVEAISWGAFAMYQIKGNDQTDKFEAYADQYWDVRHYAQWLKDQNFVGNESINPNEPDKNILAAQIRQCESQNFSHTLPEYGSQQFYELIGKYQNFQAGWTNLAHTPTKDPGPYWYETYKDPVFVNYSYERQKANDYFDYAKTGILFVVLNHILSAADAAWSVSVFNQSLKMQTGFEIKRYRSPLTGESGNMPTFNFRMDF